MVARSRPRGLEQDGELADGYEIQGGAYDGRPKVFKKDKTALGMDAEEAIWRGVLRV